MGECKNYFEKIIGRNLGIHLNPKTFWIKLRFQEIDIKKFRIQKSERKWKMLLPCRLSPNNGVTAIQSFTLAKSKIFWTSHSVAKSHQNCVSGFPTEITFNVQIFSNPTASFKTTKIWLQTAETSKKYLCFSNRLQKRWLYTSFINWTFHVQNKASRETKFQTTKWNPRSAKPRSEICSRKCLQLPNEKNLRSDACI